MYFLQDLINKLYNLWGDGCRKHTPPTYHTANSIPQHAKRENRKISNGGTAQNVENFTPAAYYNKNEAKGKGGRFSDISQRGKKMHLYLIGSVGAQSASAERLLVSRKQNIRQGPTSGTMQASSPTDCI